MKRIIAAAILAAACHGAMANISPSGMSGNTMKPMCEKGSANKPMCAGFVLGVNGGMGIASEYITDKTVQTNFNVAYGYCFEGKDVILDQLIAVFSKYLNTYPERLHNDAAFLYVAAMNEAFPCKKK